jgi:hypothetical protein
MSTSLTFDLGRPARRYEARLSGDGVVAICTIRCATRTSLTPAQGRQARRYAARSSRHGTGSLRASKPRTTVCQVKGQGRRNSPSVDDLLPKTFLPWSVKPSVTNFGHTSDLVHEIVGACRVVDSPAGDQIPRTAWTRKQPSDSGKWLRSRKPYGQRPDIGRWRASLCVRCRPSKKIAIFSLGRSCRCS